MKLGDMPASPLTDENGMPFNSVPDEQCTTGLTIRERMAMAAMTGLLSSDPDYTFEDAANHAVGHADALLAELERTGGGEDE